MRYLLDTHVVIWFFDDVDRLAKGVYDKILDPTSECFVSIASAWEIAIKMGTGKLRFDGGVSEFFNAISDNGFEILPVTREYLETLESLPLLHRDPFDRLLISTALTEELTIITADDNIQRYEVAWIWQR